MNIYEFNKRLEEEESRQAWEQTQTSAEQYLMGNPYAPDFSRATFSSLRNCVRMNLYSLIFEAVWDRPDCPDTPEHIELFYARRYLRAIRWKGIE